MEASVKKTEFKGLEAVELTSGEYTAVIVPELGSNVVRFYDTKRDIEVFRYSEAATAEDIKNSPEIWGLPTLYLPNRLDAGVLRTSDSVYHFPVNETKFGNHIHGFVHKRRHEIDMMGTVGDIAFLNTSYDYDENDLQQIILSFIIE